MMDVLFNQLPVSQQQQIQQLMNSGKNPESILTNMWDHMNPHMKPQVQGMLRQMGAPSNILNLLK